MRRLLAAAVLLGLSLGTPSLAQHRVPERVLDGAESGGHQVVHTDEVTAPLAELHPSRSVQAGPLAEVPLSRSPELDTASRIVLTEDGRMVVGGLTSGTVVQQAVATGELLWSVSLGTAVHDVAIAGTLVAAALGIDGEVVLMDLDTGDVLRRIGLPREPVQVRLSRDGTLAFVASRGADQIAVIETATGTVRTTIDTPVAILFWTRESLTGRVAYHYTPFEPTPDGSLLVVGTPDGVATFDAVTGAQVASATLGSKAFSIEMTAGSGAVVRAGSFLLQTWPLAWYDPVTGATEVQPLLPPSPASAIQTVVSEDESAVVVNAGGDAFEVPRGEAPRFLVRGGEIVDMGAGAAGVLGELLYRIDLSSMTLSDPVENPYWRDGASIVPKGGDGQTLVWVRAGERAGHVPFANREPTVEDVLLGRAPELDGPRYIALSPSGQTAALSFDRSGQVAIVDIATRRLVRTMGARMQRPSDLVFLSETELVVVGTNLIASIGRAVRLDVETGDLLQTVAQGQDPFKHVFVDRTRDRVYIHSRLTQTLYGFERDGEDLEPDSQYFAGGAPEASPLSWTVPYIAISPTGRHSVGVDPKFNEIVVNDLETGQRSVVIVEEDLDQIAFTPDGLRVAISSWEPFVHVVDLSGTPRLVATTPLDSPSYGIVYDPEAARFVASSSRGTAGSLLDIDPATGAVVGERPLADGYFADALAWSAQTGVVASGTVYEGFDAMPALWTERLGVVKMPGGFGETALVPGEGLAVVALTQTDGVGFLDLVATSRADGPATADVSLTALRTPSSRLRVRLSGAPQAHARVEVVDLLGRVVAVLHDGPFGGGDLGLSWEAAASGAYIVRLVGTGVTARATVVR